MARVANVGNSSSSATFGGPFGGAFGGALEAGSGLAVTVSVDRVDTTADTVGCSFVKLRSPDACTCRFAAALLLVVLLFASCCFPPNPRPGGIPLAWVLANFRSDTMAFVCAAACAVADGLSEGNSSTLLTLTFSGFRGG